MRHALPDGFAFVIIHRDEPLPVRGLVNAVDRADVVVVERCNGLGVAQEAFARAVVGNASAGQELEPDHAAELAVLGTTHPGAVSFRDKFVLENDATNHGVDDTAMVW